MVCFHPTFDQIAQAIDAWALGTTKPDPRIKRPQKALLGSRCPQGRWAHSWGTSGLRLQFAYAPGQMPGALGTLVTGAEVPASGMLSQMPEALRSTEWDKVPCPTYLQYPRLRCP